MKFKYEKLLTAEDRLKTVCVDGAFNAKLHLSHWPGNDSPEELKADTSTEMVFNLIESDGAEKYLDGIEIVSNNHFDTDGVLSAYVLLFPEEAKENKSLLINAATTSDFSEFTTEDALKLDLIITKSQEEESEVYPEDIKAIPFQEQMQNLYEITFERLPNYIKNLDNYENVFSEELKSYNNSELAFENQLALFSNYPEINLSVIESSEKLHKISKFQNAANDIVLSVIKAKEGFLYELEYKHYTWHETKREKKIERKSFEPIADKLNQIEKNKNGTWKVLGFDPIIEWDYRLQFSDENFNLVPSKLEVYEIEELLYEFL